MIWTVDSVEEELWSNHYFLTHCRAYQNANSLRLRLTIFYLDIAYGLRKVNTVDIFLIRAICIETIFADSFISEMS